MNMEIMTEFFGWMTLINLILFIWTAGMSVYCRGFVQRVHARVFDLSEDAVNKALYNFLAFYKIVFIVLNLAPWLALTIMVK
jgi:hypothetical protein